MRGDPSAGVATRCLSRREFLARTAATAGAVAVGGLGATFKCGGVPVPEGYRYGPFEGIYTDRLTYRHGEEIGVHLALSSEATVPIKMVVRSNEPWYPTVHTLSVKTTDYQWRATPESSTRNSLGSRRSRPAISPPASTRSPFPTRRCGPKTG